MTPIGGVKQLVSLCAFEPKCQDRSRERTTGFGDGHEDERALIATQSPEQQDFTELCAALVRDFQGQSPNIDPDQRIGDPPSRAMSQLGTKASSRSLGP